MIHCGKDGIFAIVPPEVEPGAAAETAEVVVVDFEGVCGLERDDGGFSVEYSEAGRVVGVDFHGSVAEDASGDVEHASGQYCYACLLIYSRSQSVSSGHSETAVSRRSLRRRRLHSAYYESQI